MTKKEIVARVVIWSFRIGALLVAWQAVQVCAGTVGAPIVDQLLSRMASGPDAGPQWVGKAFHYAGGIAVWGWAALCVQLIGERLARVIAVDSSGSRVDMPSITSPAPAPR